MKKSPEERDREVDELLAKINHGRHRNPAKLLSKDLKSPTKTSPHDPSHPPSADLKSSSHGTKCCGNCKYWARRVKEWGKCRRNAPKPYVLGPSSEQYFRDWQKERDLEESMEKGVAQWATPNNWRVLWPDTSPQDYCGDWVENDGEAYLPPIR